MFGMGIAELLILGSFGVVGLVTVAVIFFLIRAISGSTNSDSRDNG